MMAAPKCRQVTVKAGVLWLLCAALLFASCIIPKEKPADVSYVETTAIPARLAVLPVRYLPVEKSKAGEFPVEAGSDKGKFIGDLARGVIHNQLAGKGYDMLVLNIVDQKLGGDDWQDMSAQELCGKLEVDGLVHTEIAAATMVTAVAYDLFKIDAKVRMVNKLEAELGSWSDSASKRKIALPTSPVGLATTVVGALLDESARKQMRLVVYDWGWKVTQFMPDSPQGKSLPEVVSVDSNIDKGVFAAGEQILVEAVAEKDLTCTFDLGEFKKNLAMPYSDGGAYKGVYVVQVGDQISNQSVTVRLVRRNGVERVWSETGGTVTIDGILPPAPEKTEAQAGKQGVALSWSLPQGEDLKEFAIERSEEAVGDFALVAQTKDLGYVDAEVSQGHTYYYRVRSVDLAGNRSSQEKTVQVTMPFYDEVALSTPLAGTLVAGVYRLEGEAVVAAGEVLSIGAGSKVTLAPESRIVVKGVLRIAGSQERPTVLEGEGWKGIVISSQGQADFSHATLRGCAPCVEADGGNVRITETSIKGSEGDGVVVKEDSVLAMKGAEVSQCARGVAVEDGTATIEESTVGQNKVGLDISGGKVTLTSSNVFDNAEADIRTARKIVLEGNYLGGTVVKELKLEGDILVKSLLDAPYPHGRKVVLVDEKEITPEETEKRFEAHKSKGIEAFGERRFGDAHQELTKALKLKEDKDVYLYLAYTQSSLGEEKKMAETLEQGIEAFPYEVRLYQIYVKYLAAQGKKKDALSVLEKAMKLNPEDQNLMFMKQYVESLGE